MHAFPADPFTRTQARELGWSNSALSRRLRAGQLVSVRRGQLSRPGSMDERIAAIAAVRSVAGSVISHRSALLMHGLPIVGARSKLPEISVPPTGRGSAQAALLHRATLDGIDITMVEGHPVTSPARTVIDVARGRPIATAVAAIDAALNRSLATAEQLDDVVRRCWNWPGIRRAHRALRLSDARAESALESVSRLVIGWLRLPAPKLQSLAIDQNGYPAGRLDFYWDEFGVAGEADGRGKYDERTVLNDEKERQERLEDHGLVFVRWGWSEVVHRPQLLRTRLKSGFERGLARDRSGFPRLWSIRRPESTVREENVIEPPADRPPARKT